MSQYNMSGSGKSVTTSIESGRFLNREATTYGSNADVSAGVSALPIDIVNGHHVSKVAVYHGIGAEVWMEAADASTLTPGTDIFLTADATGKAVAATTGQIYHAQLVRKLEINETQDYGVNSIYVRVVTGVAP